MTVIERPELSQESWIPVLLCCSVIVREFTADGIQFPHLLQGGTVPFLLSQVTTRINITMYLKILMFHEHRLFRKPNTRLSLRRPNVTLDAALSVLVSIIYIIRSQFPYIWNERGHVKLSSNSKLHVCLVWFIIIALLCTNKFQKTWKSNINIRKMQNS